ncbi:MAG TPA: glycosyltransferase [Planctomycetaceae bacterium]
MLSICGEAPGWVKPEECLWLFEAAAQIKPEGAWVEVGYGPGRSFLAAGLGLPEGCRLIGVIQPQENLPQHAADPGSTAPCERTVNRLRELRPDLDITVVGGDSQSALPNIAADSIACVFVQASRNPAWIAAQLQTWQSRITPQGCLSGHGWGRPEWHGLTRAVAESLPGVSSGAGSIWTWKPVSPLAAADTPRLSVIVTTTGRDSLPATLASIRAQRLLDGDEVLLVHDAEAGIKSIIAWDQAQLPGQMLVLAGGPHGDWGAAARTAGQVRARGSHLLWQDDDDIYLPGAFDVIRREIAGSPDDILLFRLAYPGGKLLWRFPVIQCRNVSTQMYVVPRAAQLGKWGSHYQGDFEFIQTTVAANPDRRVRFVDKPTVMYSR